MIGKEVENKEIGNNMEVLVAHNSAIGNADLIPIIPQIASGTTGTTRLGDRVKPKALKVRGIVSVRPESPTLTHAPIYVRVVILAQKDVKVGAAVNTQADTAHLLRPAAAAGNEVAFLGNRNELQYPINNNKFRVYMDKVFLLAPSTGVEAQPQASFRWSYTFKQLPATLSYDEANGDWANNFAPFYGIGYCYADGSSPDAITTRLITDTYSILSFEDA